MRHRPAAALVSSPFFICSETHQEYQKVPSGRLQTQQILHKSPQRGSSSITVHPSNPGLFAFTYSPEKMLRLAL